MREGENRPAIRDVRTVTMLPQVVNTMLGTGLRWRVSGPAGRCLDLEAAVPTRTVTGTVVRVGGRLCRQARPKSNSSERTTTLPDFVVKALL